jgi:hypothetical protein
LLFSPFGCFDDEGNRRVLEQVMTALKKGGKFLLDVTNRQTALHHLATRRWWPGDQGSLLLEEVRFDAQQSRFTHLWTLIQADGHRYHLPALPLRTYALHELIRLCSEAGFSVLGVYGSENGERFDPLASPRMMDAAGRETRYPFHALSLGGSPMLPGGDGRRGHGSTTLGLPAWLNLLFTGFTISWVYF